MDASKLNGLPQIVRRQWAGKTKEEQIAEVDKSEKEISKTLHASIQKYVTEERKKGFTVRQIKKRVFKKFGIILI